MGSPESAFGIFSLSKSKLGEAANLGDYSLKTLNSLLFTTNHYFVLMRSATASASVSEGFCLLAESILKKYSAKGKVPGLIDRLQLNTDEVSYLLGPIGLSSIYYFDASDLFQIEEALAYQQSDTTQLYFSYKDTHKAAELFEQLQNLMPSKTKFTFLENNASAFSLKDNKEKVLHFKLEAGGIRVSIK